MRTSRASRETTKVFQALSPSRRQTRSSSLRTGALSKFAHNADSTVKSDGIPKIAERPRTRKDDEKSLSSANTADIEDLLEPPLKRQKRDASPKISPTPTRTPQKSIVKEDSRETISNPAKVRRKPARKTRDADGSIVVEPPSNWETIYDIVKKMREDNPTAPVDTMGCSELYWRASSPRDRRFQTLVALMLSSQTKDTVTAVAMQRLHHELGDHPGESEVNVKVEADAEAEEVAIKTEGVEIKKEQVDVQLDPQDSTLTLENMIAVSPTKLNQIIEKVGFHNNKTKYLKAAALILRDQYNGDIPSTPEDLMRLPGVGPKMAYLCMSAAWGKHQGIGVDVHVHRITNLWGWHKTKTPEETRLALQSWLPKEKWHEINKLLVGLGQTVCLPVKRRCGECYLAGTKLCKSEVKGLSPVKREVVVKGSPGEEPKVKIEA